MFSGSLKYWTWPVFRKGMTICIINAPFRGVSGDHIRGPCESLILSPSSLPRQFGLPACAWMAPISSCWFTFLIFIFLFCTPFFPFFVFSFFFVPLLWPRGTGAPEAPKIHPCRQYKLIRYHEMNGMTLIRVDDMHIVIRKGKRGLAGIQRNTLPKFRRCPRGRIYYLLSMKFSNETFE